MYTVSVYWQQRNISLHRNECTVGAMIDNLLGQKVESNANKNSLKATNFLKTHLIYNNAYLLKSTFCNIIYRRNAFGAVG